MFLFKRRWILTTILVFAAAIVMVRLGFWQLDRLAQKRAYIASATAALNAAPLDLMAVEDLDPVAQSDRMATLVGEYDYDREVVIKNKLYQDQPGFHLLTPMRLQGQDEAVLVDRGWVPAAGFDPTNLSPYREATGPIRVEGRIEAEDPRPAQAQLPASPQKEWYRVDIAALQKQTPYPLRPFYVALVPSAGHTGLPYRNPPEIVMDEGPHLGYAFQWFLFAAVVPIVYVLQVRRMDKRDTGKPVDQ